MLHRSLRGGLAALVLMPMGTLLAQAPAAEPAAQQPAAPAKAGQKMVDAYNQTQTYHATKKLKIEQKFQGMVQPHESTIQIAFNRAARQLMVENEQLRLVSDGDTLQLMIKDIPGRYLKVPAPAFEFDKFVQVAPMLGPSLLPDLVFLLGQDTSKVLENSNVTEQDGLAPEQKSVVIEGKEGKLTLDLDPASQLVDSGRFVLDVQGMGGPPDASMTMEFDVTVHQRNTPLPEGVFAFDAGNAKAVDSPRKLAPGHPLEGTRAPDFTLKTLDGREVTLSKLNDKVVVLDFWATWCGPCRRAMPLVQNVWQWAVQEKKPVEVFAVNLEEDAADVKAFLGQMKLQLPVLMDTQGKVGASYQAQSIPMTVVIARGEVFAVHVGFSPELEEELRAEINEALRAQQPAGEAAAAGQ